MNETQATEHYKKYVETTLRETIHAGKLLMNIKISRKIKWVWRGKQLPLDKPKFISMMVVLESNAPIPGSDNNPWPIFKIKKLDALIPGDEKRHEQEFVAITTVEEYFRMTNEMNNGINKLDEPGNEFVATGFGHPFDSIEDALKWEDKIRADINAFLIQLNKFVREQYKDWFSWTGDYEWIITKENEFNMSEKDWRKDHGLDKTEEPEGDEP